MSRAIGVALLAAATVQVAGCATANSYSKARTPIERAAAAYARMRIGADAVLPYLPEPTATRVRVGLALADASLAMAIASDDTATRDRALHQLAGEAAAIVADVSP